MEAMMAAPKQHRKPSTKTPESRGSEGEAQETVTVTMPAQAAEDIDARWEAAKVARANGTLKPALIAAVKAYAAKHVEDGVGWDLVVETMTDEAIWDVIQWCDYERGAISQMARKVKAVHAGRRHEADEEAGSLQAGSDDRVRGGAYLGEFQTFWMKAVRVRSAAPRGTRCGGRSAVAGSGRL